MAESLSRAPGSPVWPWHARCTNGTSRRWYWNAWPAHLTRGLAINLPGNAIQALTALGLADGITGLGVPIHRREYRNARGRLLFSVNEDEFWG